jgi:hypothetical protein
MAAKLDRVVVLNPGYSSKVPTAFISSPKTLLGAKNSSSSLGSQAVPARKQSGSPKKGVKFINQNKSSLVKPRRDSISVEDEEYDDMIKDYYKKRGIPVTIAKRITSHPDDQKLDVIRSRVESSYKNTVQPRASSQYQSSVASNNIEKGLERSDRTLLDRRKIIIKPAGASQFSRQVEPQMNSRIKPLNPADRFARQGGHGSGKVAASHEFYSPRSPREPQREALIDNSLYRLQPSEASGYPKLDFYGELYQKSQNKRMDKNPSFGLFEQGGIHNTKLPYQSSSNSNSRVPSGLLRPSFPSIDKVNFMGSERPGAQNKAVSDWELEQKLNQHLKIAEQLRERGRMFRESKKYSDELLIESILSDGYKQTIQEHIKEWHGIRAPQSYLEYNKSKAKPTTKVGEFNQQIKHIADEAKSHEVKEYAVTNLHKFDKEAAQEPIRFKHLQKRNILSGLKDVRLQSAQKELPENKYLESIRAKFGFLEGVIYSNGEPKPKPSKPQNLDTKGLR